MEIIIAMILLLLVVAGLTYLVLIIEILEDEADGIMYELDDLDRLILLLFD